MTNGSPRRAVLGLLTTVALLGLCVPAYCVQSGVKDETNSAAFSVSGTVVSERDGAPVASCHLTATPSSGATPQRSPRQRNRAVSEGPSTDCDAGGHFRLALPSAGGWQLSAFGRGFRQQFYDHHDNFFTGIVLTPAIPSYEVVFTMEPDSAIWGFVLDEAGDGVRNARLTLAAAESSNPDVVGGAGSVRSATITDDRGHYEFAGLSPGEYTVGVQAEPWYAAGLQSRRFLNQPGAVTDAALDVVYPPTWFPGVTDRRAADIISLHHGENRQASFNLTPIPSSHLRISPPANVESAQRGQSFPMIERVAQDGGSFMNTSMQVDSQGQIDVGGLSPGVYRVLLQRSEGTQSPMFLRVPSGTQRYLDLSAAIPAADLTLHLASDGDADRVQVVLTDVESGARFITSSQGNLQRRREREQTETPAGDRKLEVPPSRYQVTLFGDGDVYLAGISIKNARVDGRIINVASGSTTLDLRLTRGRASVRGIAALANGPAAGAMVMLVPVTFGEPGSITMLRRDQSNTDGGFAIEGIIPGDYILLAIDHGWTMNWHDPSTLQRYLLHGIPITLTSNVNVTQNLVTQNP